MNQYVKQYQKSSIETASREQILIMLYDGAIQFLNKAKIAMQNKEIENAHNNLIRAQNIIQEFIDSLDKEIAPQLAENLISLYEYFLRRLTYANMKKQTQPIDEVLSYLKSLKATWEKAIELSQKEVQQSNDIYQNSASEGHSYNDLSDDDEDEEDEDEEYEDDDEDEE